MPGVYHGTQKRQIISLTTKSKKMIAALIASGIEIPNSDPSLGEEDDKDHKMAANKKNSNLTKIKKSKKLWTRRPQGNKRCMFCDCVADAPV